MRGGHYAQYGTCLHRRRTKVYGIGLLIYRRRDRTLPGRQVFIRHIRPTDGRPHSQKDSARDRANLRLRHLILISLLVFSFAGVDFYILSRISFLRSSVANIYTPEFFRKRVPPGFIPQDRHSSRLHLFRRYLPNVGTPSLASAIAVRHWVRSQQASGSSWTPHSPTLLERLKGDLDDPLSILNAQRGGAWAVCRQFSYLMVGAAESAGLDARVIIATSTFWKLPGAEGHVMTEVWIPELKKWVLMDPMWDLTFTLNGIPASALEIYHAVRQNRGHSIRAIGNLSCPYIDKTALRREFTHLYISMTNALFDGYRVEFLGRKSINFAHLVTPSSPRYPDLEKVGAMFFGFLATAVSLFTLGLAFIRHNTSFHR